MSRWGKLAGLALLTTVAVFSIIPYALPVVMTDPGVRPPPPTIWAIVHGMHFPPETLALSAIILGIAAFAAVQIVRRRW